MKTISFICTHCENIRPVTISEANEHYIIGSCNVCKSRIVLNRKRFKKSKLLPR